MQQEKVPRKKQSGSPSSTLKISEDVSEVALDAEIDKLLEEKAAKTNLSVLNVKSVIRQVVQNQMVQEMIAATVRRKERAERKKEKEILSANGATVSSDDDDDEEDLHYFEPKLTRAKTKELLENQVQPPLWPISPGKFLPSSSPSEAQVLISDILPEESEPEDEDYVPKESDLHHSDEDSISRSSFSDIGSPATPTRSNISSISLRSKRKRGGEDAVDSVFPATPDSLFKTPSASPRARRGRPIDSAIGLRTRSRHPLNDTPLEALESQLIPPDITTDMYEWNINELEENPDYLDFVKDFKSSFDPLTTVETHDDEEADPEYNVMEDEEDDHDKEEHREDRAVKVTKKELNDLWAEFLDGCQFSSGDEMENLSVAGQRQGKELDKCVTASTIIENHNAAGPSGSSKPVVVSSPNPNLSNSITETPPDANVSLVETDTELDVSISSQMESNTVPASGEPSSQQEDTTTKSSDIAEIQKVASEVQVQNVSFCPSMELPLFSEVTYTTLQHQLQQHIQLLTQSYILAAQVEEPAFVKAAHTTKSLLLSLDNSCKARGPTSVFSVKNLREAVKLVTSWPPKFTSNSPIKKKILEAQDFNALCLNKIDGLSVYEREIVKLMGTNKTFMYGRLLPTSILPNMDSTMYFTPNEDALIVLGLETLKACKTSLRQNADMLSQTLLPVRTYDQIYHRVRNLKKMSYKHGSANIIRDYFVEKKIPSTPLLDYLPEMPLPPIEQPESNLKPAWINFLHRVFGCQSMRALTDLSDLNSQLASSASHKIKKRKKKLASNVDDDLNGTLIMVTSEVEAQKRPRRRRRGKKEVLKKTMPFMNEVLSKVDPAYEIFPVNGFNGNTEFYCTVPKFVMVPPEKELTTIPVPDKDSDRVNDIYPYSNSALKSPSSSPQSHSSATTACSTPVRAQRSTAGFDSPRKSSSAPKLVLVSADMSRDSPKKKKLNCLNRAIISSQKKGEMVDAEVVEDESIDSDYVVEPSEEMDEADDEFEPEVLDLREDNDSIFCFSNSKLRGREPTAASKETATPPPQNPSSNEGKDTNTEGSTANATSEQTTANQGSGVAGGSAEGEDDNNEEHNKPRATEKFTDVNVLDNNDQSTETDEEWLPDKNKRQKGAERMNLINPMQSNKPSDLGKSVVSKKCKRSPGNSSSSTKPGTGHGKRVSKYNTASAETMLRSSTDDEEVRSAFAEAYFSKVQQRIEVESKNPALFSSYIQAFAEFQSNSITEDQFIGKGEELLKDFPDLVREFLGMFQPSPGASTEHFESHEECQAQVYFLELLEKWTSNCPQLKTKILHKLKILRDEPNLTERRIVTAIQPFFSQIPNPLMMDAFKALFPSVFRPEAISSASDFEEIDLDMEESKAELNPNQPPLGDIEAMDNFEVVKLPDEKSVPATSTCTCPCHGDPANISFYTRAKHCNKCRLKFQDGKVFVHSGRIMKPVSVEFANPDLAKRISTGSACVSCLNPKRRTTDNASASSSSAGTVSHDNVAEEEGSQPKKIKPSLDTHVDFNSDQPSSSSVDSLLVRPWTLTEDRTILMSCQTSSDIETGVSELSNIFTDRSISEIKSRFTELFNLIQEDEDSEEILDC